MKAAKLIAISFLIYVGIVVAFESYYGYFQPAGYFQTTLVITTTAEDGTPNDRVLSRVESNGQLYVSANHWPRAWYNRALVNPKVQARVHPCRQLGGNGFHARQRRNPARAGQPPLAPGARGRESRGGAGRDAQGLGDLLAGKGAARTGG